MKLKYDISEKPPLFFANHEVKERVIVNQGGTSSGKTWTILDILFILAMSEPGITVTVVGQDIPNLKAGAYRDAKYIWSSSELYSQWYDRPNETERYFTCRNGSVIEFKSYSDEQDAKSGKRDYLFVNEANGIPYNIYQRLEERTYKKIYLDYNPSARFWVHEELINKPDVKLIISDHRSNPYLSEDTHQRIESYTGERFRVYSRGLTGKMDGLIYSNWELCESMPEIYKIRYIGLDFGFTNDPTAIIDVRLSNGELWLDELCYKSGLTNPDISGVLKENGIHGNINIVADSAEPKSIVEIQNLGHRIEGANKGHDSIKNGIDILQRYKLNVTRRSLGLRKELGAYEWKKNKNGIFTNEPIGEFNHALDAVRYVGLNKLREVKKFSPPTARSIKMY